MPEEKQRNSHHQGSSKVPNLPSAVAKMSLIAEKSNHWGCHGICNLTNQENEPGVGVVDMDDHVVEEDEVGEPHAGTHIVVEMTDSIGELLPDGESLPARPGGRKKGVLRPLVWRFILADVRHLLIHTSRTKSVHCKCIISALWEREYMSHASCLGTRLAEHLVSSPDVHLFLRLGTKSKENYHPTLVPPCKSRSHITPAIPT